MDAGNERVLRLQANVDVFGNAHREVIAQTDALGELAEHPDGLMAVDLWLDGRLLQNDVVVACSRDEILTLEGHEIGQHVVGDFAGVGEPHVIVDDKLHVLHDIEPSLAIGLLVHGIAAAYDERLVGAVIGLGRRKPLRHAHGHRLHAGNAIGAADGDVVEDERPALELQRLEDAATRLAQASRQGAEQQELAIGLVGVAVAQAIARQDEGVFRLDPVTCKTLGVLGADTALLGGELEGVLRRGVLELLQCRGVALTVDLVATEELDVGPLGVISALGRNTDGGVARRIPDKIAAIVGIAGEQPRLVIDEVGGD